METKELKRLAKNLSLAAKKEETLQDLQDRCFKAALDHVKNTALHPRKTLIKKLAFLRSSEGKSLLTEAIITQDPLLFNKLLSMSMKLDVCDKKAHKALQSKVKDLFTFLSQVPLKKAL